MFSLFSMSIYAYWKQVYRLILPMSPLLQELIITYGGLILHNKFDLSSLTKISDGWSSGSICKTVQETLTEKRILQQKFRQLEVSENNQVILI